jgi:hypothetical protein
METASKGNNNTSNNVSIQPKMEEVDLTKELVAKICLLADDEELNTPEV